MVSKSDKNKTVDIDSVGAELINILEKDFDFDLHECKGDNIYFYKYSSFGSTYKIVYSQSEHTIFKADIAFHLTDHIEVMEQNQFDSPTQVFEISYAELLYILKNIYTRMAVSKKLSFHLHLSDDGNDATFFESIDFVPIETLEEDTDPNLDAPAKKAPASQPAKPANKRGRTKNKDDDNDGGACAA